MKTTVNAMGYKSVNECIESLKERNILGDPVDYERQRESDRIGYLRLGIERIKRAGRINTEDFKDVIEKLSNYGMSFIDAQNQIIALFLHEQIQIG